MNRTTEIDDACRLNDMTDRQKVVMESAYAIGYANGLRAGAEQRDELLAALRAVAKANHLASSEEHFGELVTELMNQIMDAIAKAETLTAGEPAE